MKLTRLFLVRHAETEWNQHNRYQGHLDIKLSAHGREQARLLGERLAHEEIAAVFSSDLSRAYETATAIAGWHKLSVEPMPALREIDVGQWEGLTLGEIMEKYPDTYEMWRQDTANVPFPGGECYLDVQRRVMPAIDEIVRRYPGQNVVAVSHSGPLKAAICALTGLDLNLRRRFNLSNASLTVVVFTADGPRIEFLNDTCHLR